ncbi:MAG: hypothetical protein OHK0024_35260 [Thalassobaculales bacterium]
MNEIGSTDARIDLFRPDGDVYAGLRMTRHGLMMFPVKDMYIGRSLEEYGEYCAGKMDLLVSMLKPGDVAVDVGAHIGSMTLAMARAVYPNGVCVAYEPQRVLHQMLCGNAQMNGLDNAFLLHAAVGETPGEIIVPMLDYRMEANYGGLELGGFTQGEAVPLARLDGLDLGACRLIKVSAEGNELQVLKGAERVLRRFRPVLYLDGHHADRTEALLTYVMGLGYRCFWDLQPMFRADNFYGKTENVFGAVVTVGILCLSPSEATPEGAREIVDPGETWSGGRPVEEVVPQPR